MKRRWLKKLLLISLTMAIMLVGASSAFADGKGKGKGNNWNNGRGNGNNGKGNAAVVNTNINLNIDFKDLQGGDVEWAIQYIMSLAAKKVFQGFEDGTFRPREPITRIQAIKAAVSTMGLGHLAETREEMNTKLNFKDAKDVPDWAVGYVSIALKNNLFVETEDRVQPNKPADRLWFTRLMIKALALDDEARENMTENLNFRDANQIPAPSIGYVKVSVDRGLISGYDDRTFRPNQPVTRAEAAKLLAITGEQIEEEQDNVLRGTVMFNVTNQITIRTGQNNTASYLLHPSSNVPVFRNGQMVTVSDIRVGDEVKLQTYTANNTQYVHYIEITKLADENKSDYSATGKYNFFGPNNEGQNIIILIQNVNGANTPITYIVDKDVALKLNGHALAFGATVKLEIKQGVAKSIEIIAPAEQ